MTPFKHDLQRTAKTLKIAAGLGLLCLAACGHHAPSTRPIVAEAGVARLTAFEAPACGARVFVAMGRNQKYPSDENMRVPLGDLFLNGDFIDTVSKFPEITVLDVPAGKTQLSWVPSSYDQIARSNTKQDNLTLSLADHETAFVVLDWYDDTPQVSGFFATPPANAFRTEVASARSDVFAGKRIVFHRRLDTPCPSTMPQTTASTIQPPPQVAAQIPQSLPAVIPPPAPPPPQQVVPPAPKPQPVQMPPAPPPVAAVSSKPAPVAPPVPKPKQVAPPPAPQQAAVASPKPEEIAPAPPPPPAPSIKPPEAAPPPPPRQTELSIAPPQQAAVPTPPPRPGEAAGEATGDMAVLQAFVPPVQYYYTVNAREGAPAFSAPRAEGTPLYTFKDTTELNVVTVDADKKWLKVKLPDGRAGYVSAALVATGARLQP